RASSRGSRGCRPTAADREASGKYRRHVCAMLSQDRHFRQHRLGIASAVQRAVLARKQALAIIGATMDQEPLIVVERVSRWYGSHLALNDISFTVRRG